MNLKKILFELFICILVFGFSCADAASSSDNNIVVNVTSTGSLPLMIKNRMQASVSVIAQQLMDGKTTDDIEQNKAHYADIINEVFDKILVGYTVSSVDITTDGRIEVTVNLLPWDYTIQDVQVEVKTDGVSDEIAALAISDIKDISSFFNSNLCGLPIDAVDWSNGALKYSLDNFMQKNLPEFRADFEMETGTVTKVTVTIYPRMPVVRNIDLMMRSSSVPNMYLLQERMILQNRADMILGVPIAFVNRHSDYFRQKFAHALDERTSFRLLDIHTNIVMVTGEKTTITSYSDTKKYNISIEGWADFGRDADDDSVTYRLHAGEYLNSKSEVFAQMFFRPQKAQVDWTAGLYYHFTDKLYSGGRYYFNDDYWSLDTQYIFNKKWLMRFDYAPQNDNWEGAIRYNVHDFISLEYVWEQRNHKNDNWLRLIGHF